MADRTAQTPDTDGTPPDASIEPAAQATAPAADAPAAPLPADYEMPDDYAADDPVAQVKTWVEDHPGLAILGAAGVGLLVGRLVSGLVSEPEPTLTDRVERRARQLQKTASVRGRAVATDANATLQESLHRASEALKEAASHAGDAAEEGYEKTKDLAETIADAAKVAVTGVLATKIDDWVKKVRD